MTASAGNTFRVSLYTAICLATIGLWMGEDNPPPYPLLVIFCCVAAYAFTDTWGMLTIPAALHVWLAVAVVAFFVREEMAGYKLDPVMPLGHLIMLFQIILLFHVKTPRTHWLLLVTSFLQMLIAALHNSRLTFGILMGIFLGLIVWTMTQFLLLRETERYTALDVQRPSRSGLRRTVAGSLGSSLVIFLGAMLLFFVIPRRGQTAWTQAAHRPGQYLSGFDERIRLGQLGTILESDEEVMTIRLFDERGQTYHPAEEPYWRGVALSYYEGGRWERFLDVEVMQLDWVRTPERYIRQDIRLQGIHRDVLFGLWPAFRGQTRSGEPLGKIGRDGTLIRPDNAPIGPLQYTVDSVPNARVRLRDEVGHFLEDRDERWRQLTQVPDTLVGPLQQYAIQHNLTMKKGPDEFCRELLDHLQDPNEFDYTLRATMNPGMDPVLDFLLNRKEGHCEYFASAMTLLLRAHKVPARVINGFKGGDWNDLFGPSIVVRQKHAHSWVEALLPSADRGELVWVVLDPTPGPGRQRATAMVNSTPSLLRQVGDVSRQIWSNYVLNFNSSEQELAVYAPMRRLVIDQGRKLAERARHAWEQRSRAFNWTAAIAASFLTLALIIGMRLAVRHLSRGQLIRMESSGGAPRGAFGRFMQRLRRILARWTATTSAFHPRVAFYDELLQQLESHGLHKQATWTARQFAQHAGVELERVPEAATAARIPAELVDRYYRVRFGLESLNESEAEEIGRMLDVLGKTLRR
jgi:hypothetical protein